MRCLLLLSLALTLAGTAEAAPAPWPRTITPGRRHLHRDNLAGSWSMDWSGHTWLVTLSRDGGYTATSGGVLTFVGSWSVDHLGRLWITETSRPDDPESWRSYRILFAAGTLAGTCEIGSPGTPVRFTRR